MSITLGTYYRMPAQPPALHKPLHGFNRAYFSAADARAYDLGWIAHDSGQDCPEGCGPGWQGWMDAQGAAVRAAVEGWA